ncbi:MAG: 50S ribosomal protein L3 [Verrucomicrobia subdivision 3 bacterium]|nr:50S ribosomal protein L3 [Limisphaerales bacterium]MCS1416002.1 50S ribosomal protein L3 [Limisphaerales bacterium]
MVGLLGKKLGQTQVYDEGGDLVCVTAVECRPNRVLQCKTEETDGYNAVQLGFGVQKPQRVNKPLTGHYHKHGAEPCQKIKEFRDFEVSVKPGDEVKLADCFFAGDFVDAIGVTKGHGFQGVMKRHGFGGGRATHGAKGWKRRPGSIGQGSTPGYVRKGQPMPGHMGQVRRTVQNLKVVRIMEEDNVVLVSGAIPGAVGDYVVIRSAKKKKAST